MTIKEWSAALGKFGFTANALSYSNQWPKFNPPVPGWVAQAKRNEIGQGTVTFFVFLEGFGQTRDEAMNVVLREARKDHEERKAEREAAREIKLIEAEGKKRYIDDIPIIPSKSELSEVELRFIREQWNPGQSASWEAVARTLIKEGE